MTHEHRFQIICGQEVCGVCYEQDLLKEPIKSNGRKEEEIEVVYSKDAHRMVMRRKRSD